jgi:hypothetical protein
MGCGDMPNMTNKCHCKNRYKFEVPIIELSTFFVIVFWAVIIFLIVIFAICIHLAFAHFVVAVGSLAREPVRYQIQTEPLNLDNSLLLNYEFEIEPVKIQRGCEYWYGVVDQLEATSEEKDWIKKIMYCESKCNPDAVSSANSIGLLQFQQRTWDWQGGGDINNPYEQIQKALEMYRKGLRKHWCCDALI